MSERPVGNHDIIATRIHPKIREKLPIWGLIQDSYAGGQRYTGKRHLFRYPKESKIEYEARAKRAVFFNHVQPLADMIAGFIYKTPIVRKVVGALDFMVSKASRRKTLESFMQTVAVHSVMYTVGVLVDSPAFQEGEVKTKADEISRGIKPYCVMYTPDKIRDFYADDQGVLQWILLDDSELEADDPMVEAKQKTIYRLWTIESITDFEIKAANGEQEVTVVRERPNPIGEIPFIFVNWRDMDEDFIAETPFEDIALLDRQIFNFLSYFDQMVAGGTFKSLFYPSIDGAVPESIMKEGLGDLSVVPYPPAEGGKPFYDGQGLSEVGPFIAGMEMYFSQIMEKLGLDMEQKKTSSPQSGYAKELDFARCEALLKLGSEQLRNTEIRIFELAAKWTGTEAPGIEIKYPANFASKDIAQALQGLYQLLTAPFRTMRKLAWKEIASLALPDLSTKDRQALDQEIESLPEPTRPTSVKDLADQEAADRQ